MICYEKLYSFFISNGEGKMKVIYKIKEIRKEKNMTLSYLSGLSGISKSQINDIENGIKEPSNITLILIANALKVKVEELYEIKW